jgi:chromosome segregation ATPase
MTPELWISLIVALLSPLLSVLYARRTINAERMKLYAEKTKIDAEAENIRGRTATEEVDRFAKLSENLEKLQDRNTALYDEKITLEKQNTEQFKTIETLTHRLNEREGQLNSANKQIELFRKLAEDAPITSTLRAQIEEFGQIIKDMTGVQNRAMKMLEEKDRAITVLTETNRDLRMKGEK